MTIMGHILDRFPILVTATSAFVYDMWQNIVNRLCQMGLVLFLGSIELCALVSIGRNSKHKMSSSGKIANFYTQ